MTVHELIAKLQDMPPESQIVAREMDGGFFPVDADAAIYEAEILAAA